MLGDFFWAFDLGGRHCGSAFRISDEWFPFGKSKTWGWTAWGWDIEVSMQFVHRNVSRAYMWQVDTSSAYAWHFTEDPSRLSCLLCHIVSYCVILCHIVSIVSLIGSRRHRLCWSLPDPTRPVSSGVRSQSTLQEKPKETKSEIQEVAGIELRFRNDWMSARQWRYSRESAIWDYVGPIPRVAMWNDLVPSSPSPYFFSCAERLFIIQVLGFMIAALKQPVAIQHTFVNSLSNRI